MKYPFFLSLALGFSWILSPESLVISGNLTGQLGWMTLPALAGVALLFIFCSRLIGDPQLPAQSNREFLILQRTIGSISATAVTLAAFLPLTVVAGTALLVTAGYTFNEVFLYWFPNFGFAFLLLALLTVLQFLKEKLALLAQVFFVVLAAGGLLLLSFYGVPGTGTDGTAAAVPSASNFSPFSATPLLLLFVGCNWSHKQAGGTFFLVPVIAFFLFFLWSLASLSHVSPDRLASSTIPYMTAARKILGDPGRLIMGVVIISGTCGAVNGLMILSRRMFTTVAAEHGLSPGKQGVIPLFLALLIAALMATGLAGEELLESLLRGALILWLLYYTLLCLSSVHMLRKASAATPYPALFCTLLLMAGCIGLLVHNPQPIHITLFIFSVLSASGLLSGCWYIISKRNRHEPKPKEKTA